MKALALLTSAALITLTGGAALAASAPAAPADIVRLATDLPPPIEASGPRTHKVSLETTEVIGTLADGATYKYWTYNSK
ncbi:MAG: multicopper oxidase, partial [Caulobacter sp.]|nr:multicopper oxidase [Caulobacter sp.]